MNTNVERHAAALEQAAAAMVAAGIGSDPKAGHAATLIAMAADLRAQSDLGRNPTTFEAFSAVADHSDAERKFNRTKTLLEAISAAASDETRLHALQNIKARADRAGYTIPFDEVIKLVDLDRALDQAGTKIDDRFALKADLARAGLLSLS
jgi:hypothetical protein